jgi:alginate O-acetyltransferase complex protein AlgJ
MIGRAGSPDPDGAWIGRRTATALSAAFLLFLAVPAVHQAVTEIREGSGWKVLALFRRRPSAVALKQFEQDLARDSRLGTQAGAAYQSFLTSVLREGNDKVIIGRGGLLFYRREVEMAAGPGFLSARRRVRRGSSEGGAEGTSSDPVAAIVDYDRRLRARGIHLLFVPLPVKPFLYPEALRPEYPAEAGPAWNVDRERFMRELSRAGVDVLDVTDDLWRAKAEGEVFLRLDTHWAPRGVRVAADRIAERLRPLTGPPQKPYEGRTATATNGGDLLRMLGLGAGPSTFPTQTVEIVQGPPRGDDLAPVLLLGDSHTNIYSRKELEWGEGAGLAEQLMLRLGVPVQVLALNGGAATQVRTILGRKPAVLAAKKIVVWSCTSRDLDDVAVSWDKVPLPGEER